MPFSWQIQVATASSLLTLIQSKWKESESRGTSGCSLSLLQSKLIIKKVSRPTQHMYTRVTCTPSVRAAHCRRSIVPWWVWVHLRDTEVPIISSEDEKNEYILFHGRVVREIVFELVTLSVIESSGKRAQTGDVQFLFSLDQHFLAKLIAAFGINGSELILTYYTILFHNCLELPAVK